MLGYYKSGKMALQLDYAISRWVLLDPWALLIIDISPEWSRMSAPGEKHCKSCAGGVDMKIVEMFRLASELWLEFKSIEVLL